MIFFLKWIFPTMSLFKLGTKYNLIYIFTIAKNKIKRREEKHEQNMTRTTQARTRTHTHRPEHDQMNESTRTLGDEDFLTFRQVKPISGSAAQKTQVRHIGHMIRKEKNEI